MRRREFMTLLGGAAAAWPLAARAQQGADTGDWLPERLGMPSDLGFQQGLKEIGLVEGRDYAIEYHSIGGQNDRLPAIVADVVARRVTVILASRQRFLCTGGKGGNDSDTDRLYRGQ